MKATKEEIIRLVLPTEDEIEKKTDRKHYRYRDRLKAYALFVSMVALLVLIVVMFRSGNHGDGFGTSFLLKGSPKCQFCDQSQPKFYDDKSYTISIKGASTNASTSTNADDDADAGLDHSVYEDIVVTPMTVTYDYDLYDGQIIFTDPLTETIPNVDFDYAIVGVTSVKHINRDTNEPVSLDEVYLHHIVMPPLNMIGAEVLANDKDTPYVKYPDGYALHVIAEDTPRIHVNAHMLSNKNLAPVQGSLSRAHKECNECYYAPGKGSDCTPEFSGKFACCGDSIACTTGGEQCACATTTEADRSTTTKYRMEFTFLTSLDISKFKRVDHWTFTAPACSVNLNGDSVFKEEPSDNFCFGQSKGTVLDSGGGSLFHQVSEDNVNPYVKTKINVVAPTGGKIVWAQAHLHTGGINATLLLNGVVQCTADSVYGTNSDVATNARNEQNHLINIGTCYDEVGETGIRFEEGDIFTTESFYYGGTDDKRMDGADSAGEHKNVMSYFSLNVDFDGDTKLFTQKRSSIAFWNNLALNAGL